MHGADGPGGVLSSVRRKDSTEWNLPLPLTSLVGEEETPFLI